MTPLRWLLVIAAILVVWGIQYDMEIADRADYCARVKVKPLEDWRHIRQSECLK